MKTSVILFGIACLFGLNSSAIRHVGNGGGDAEMLLLKQYSAVPLWLKACQENKFDCPNFPSLKRFDLIAFVAAEDKVQDCTADTLFVANDSLYLNQSTAKSESDVFNQLLDVLNSCFFNQHLATVIKTDVLPQVLMQSVNDVAILKGISKDYFVSTIPEENLNQLVQTKTKCNRLKFLRVWSTHPLSVLVRCESSKENYLIRIKQGQNPGHLIDVRYFSDGLSDN